MPKIDVLTRQHFSFRALSRYWHGGCYSNSTSRGLPGLHFSILIKLQAIIIYQHHNGLFRLGTAALSWTCLLLRDDGLFSLWWGRQYRISVGPVRRWLSVWSDLFVRCARRRYHRLLYFKRPQMQIERLKISLVGWNHKLSPEELLMTVLPLPVPSLPIVILRRNHINQNSV